MQSEESSSSTQYFGVSAFVTLLVLGPFLAFLILGFFLDGIMSIEERSFIKMRRFFSGPWLVAILCSLLLLHQQGLRLVRLFYGSSRINETGAAA